MTVKCEQSGLEGLVRPGDHEAGDGQGGPRLHRAVPQRRQAYTGGAAGDHRVPAAGGLYLCADLGADHAGNLR